MFNLPDAAIAKYKFDQSVGVPKGDEFLRIFADFCQILAKISTQKLVK